MYDIARSYDPSLPHNSHNSLFKYIDAIWHMEIVWNVLSSVQLPTNSISVYGQYNKPCMASWRLLLILTSALKTAFIIGNFSIRR